jgi:CUG-BP- and ETR3-like factor
VFSFILFLVMAEGKKEKKSSSSSSSSSSNEESVKLFVGQVPKNMTEAELLAMFKDFALVDEVNIIKDKTTRASRGCLLALVSSHSPDFFPFDSRFVMCSHSYNPNFYLFLGCCFLICPSRQEADKAVNACHNKKTLPGVSSFFNLISPCIVYYLLFSCFLSHCIVDEISDPGKPLE